MSENDEDSGSTKVLTTKTPENFLNIVSVKDNITKVPETVEGSISSEPEKKELTEEEKKAIFIQKLKDSKIVYHPRKKFGVAYHKKRKTKNKMQRQSRKNNR